MLYIVLGVFALFIGALWVLVKVVEAKKGEGDDAPPTAELPPFKKKDWLLTKGEKAFYDALRQAVGSAVVICPKVRLADLVWIPKGEKDRRTWLNRVDRKHIDFVLCRAGTLSPVLAIELDDASHNSERAKKRDQVKDDVLKAAGLPMLRVKAAGSYDPAKIRADVQGAVVSAGGGNDDEGHASR